MKPWRARLAKPACRRPRKLQSDNLIHAEFDSTLVTVDGLLVSVRETPAGQALEMRSGVAHIYGPAQYQG